MTATGTDAVRKRLFISYRHGSEDSSQESIIRHLRDRFSERHQIFTDKNILPGNRWGEQIEAEIGACDVFVPLLTFDAMWSEMVIDEVERHLQITIRDWTSHYNRGRPHSALGPGLPEPGSGQVSLNEHRHRVPVG
jgi:hypothetical protein